MLIDVEYYREQIQDFDLSQSQKFHQFDIHFPDYRQNIADCIDYVIRYKYRIFRIFSRIVSLFEEWFHTETPLSLDAYRIPQHLSELHSIEKKIKIELDHILYRLQRLNKEIDITGTIRFNTIYDNTLHLLEDHELIENEIHTTGYEKTIDALLSLYGDGLDKAERLKKSYKERSDQERRIDSFLNRHDFSGIHGNIKTIFNYFRKVLVSLKTIFDLKYHVSLSVADSSEIPTHQAGWFGKWFKKVMRSSFDVPKQPSMSAHQHSDVIAIAEVCLNEIIDDVYYHSPAIDILKQGGNLINQDVAITLMFEVIDLSVLKPLAKQTKEEFKAYQV